MLFSRIQRVAAVASVAPLAPWPDGSIDRPKRFAATGVYPVSEDLVPILERIARSVAATVAGASGVSAVYRPAAGDPAIPVRDGVVILTQDESAAATAAFGFLRWRQPFVLDLFARKTRSDATPLEQHINTLVAAVTAALAGNPTCDGWAIDSRVEGVQNFAPDAGYAAESGAGGATIRLVVDYETIETDCYRTGG